MAITIPYSFTDGNTIVAAQHNSNFNAIASFVDALQAGTNFNAQAIGTTAIADDAVTSIKIAANAVGLSELATAIADALNPTGSIVAYAGASAPNGWLVCDGTAFSSVTYPALYALLGNVAVLPNLTDRFIVGKSGTKTIRTTGGSETIAEANLPVHTHPNTVASVTVAGTVAVTLAGGSHNHTGTTDAQSNDHQHPQEVQKTTNTTHTHNVNGTSAAGMSSPTGTSTDNTGVQSNGHNHPFTTSTENAGVTVSGASFTQTSGSATMANAPIGSGTAFVPQYYAVTYIIKAA